MNECEQKEKRHDRIRKAKKQMTETTVQGKGAALPPEQEVRSGAKPEKVFTRSL